MRNWGFWWRNGRLRLAEADEIIVSSTSHPSMRAMELDGKAVGMKNPELVKKLRDKYMEEIEK